MCGFIYQEIKKSNLKLNKFNFKKASKLIYHRGPDSKNYISNKNINIFHARLKIIDLKSRSDQPMTRLGYTIIFNGEIYNFKKLKNELVKEFQFQTNSDTEVLLYSYIKWKDKMFSKINGMFSFLIFNEKKKILFFARDLFGQKPLYFFNNKEQIIFSSEIKPIIQLTGNKIIFEEKEIYKYLNFNYYGDGEETFFKQIFQVKPGTYGYFKNKKFIFNKINYKSKQIKYTPNKISNLLQSEVKDHLVADVESAIMISDGIDSKSILDISNIKFNKKLKLFNLSFEDFDNNKFEEKYLKDKKNNLFITKFSKKEMMPNLKNAAKFCEAPPLSLFTIGMLKLFKNIKKKKIKVVLNGQGIDEVFGGYNSLFFKKDQKKQYHPDGSILINTNKVYKKKIPSKLNNHNSFKSQRKEMAFISKIPKNLNQYDKISMNFSVECRSPYLTKNLAKLLNHLKVSNSYYNKHKKYIFRKTLYNMTKDKFYFTEKNFKQAPQTEFMLDKSNINKISKIIYKKNYCDRYFNKINLIKYFKEFKNLKNNGFIVWQYISLNSFINSFKKL